MKLDYHNMKEVMKIFQKYQVEELSYEGEQGKLKLKSSTSIRIKPILSKKEESFEIEESIERSTYIISEEIGKYYFRQENGNTYVEVGQSIKVGEIIGYVTSIGISTPFVSKKSGVVEEILVKNGDIIDYGKKLIKIRT